MRRTMTLVITALLVVTALPASASDDDIQQPTDRTERLVVDLFRSTLSAEPEANPFLKQLDEIGGRTCGCDIVYPIHDLDLDGVDEVVDAELHEDSDARSTVLNVRNGEDGALLFAEPVHLPGYTYASSATVGADGERGLVYRSYDYSLSARYEVVFELTVGALDAQGHQLWQRKWLQTYGTRSLLPGAFRDLEYIHPPGEPTRIVIAHTAMPEEVHLLRLEEVSASDGSTTASWTGPAPQAGEVFLQAADALFSDTTTGFLVKINPIDAERPELLAFGAVADGPRWTRTLPRYGGVLGVANLLGGAASEVAIAGHGRTRRIELLNGQTGQRVWERRISGARTVADAGGDGRSDLLVAPDSFTKVNDRLTAQVRRLQLGSGTMWRSDVSFGPGHFREWDNVWATSTGDADLDGHSEVVVELSSWIAPDDEIEIVRNKQVLLNGRTGKLMDQGRNLFPLEGTLDGTGTDGVRLSVTAGAVAISGVDGRNGATSWRSELDVGARTGWDPCLWDIEIVDGPRSDDVLLIIPTAGGDEEVLLDGVTGQVQWHLDG